MASTSSSLIHTTDEFGRSRPSLSLPFAPEDLRSTLPRRPRNDSDLGDGRRRTISSRMSSSPTRSSHRDRDRPTYREQQQRGPVLDPMTLDYLVDWKTYAAWLRSKKELAERPANREEDEAQYQEILARYDAYKTQWTRQFQRKFFLAHEHEDWMKEKYHPDHAELRLTNLKQMKHLLFETFTSLDLPNGKYDVIDLDALPTAEPTGNEPEIADRADQALKTLHIKSVPLHIPRSQLQAAFAGMPGYKYLSLSEPRIPAATDRNGPFTQSNMPSQFALGPRTGWVVFDSVQNAEDALAAVKSAQDNAADAADALKIMYNLTANIVPVGVPKFRTTISEAFSHPDRILIDLEQVKQIAARLDVQFGLNGVAMLAERYPTATEKECLDKLIQYLRKVHLYCYYSSGVEAESMEELAWKCGDRVFRKPGDCDLTTDRMVGFLNKFDTKIKLRFDPPTEPGALVPYGALTMDHAVDVALQNHVQREDEGRFRCVVNGCEKLFRDTGFVIKHIKNKHADVVNPEIEVAVSMNVYVNAFLLDPHHLVPRDPSGNQGALGVFSSTTPFRLPGAYNRYHSNGAPGSRNAERFTMAGVGAVGMHDERGFGSHKSVRSPVGFAFPVPDARSMDPRGIKYYTDLDAPAEGDVVLDYD